MKLISIPLIEQETTISFGRTEKGVFIWTNDRTMMTKLDRLCQTAPDNYKCIDIGFSPENEVMDKRYAIADKSLLSFRQRRQKPREYTEEQKKALAEQLRRQRLAE